MKRSDEYLCPICERGHMTITEERTGPPGFRDTDYDIIDKTCECISFAPDVIISAIKSYKGDKYIPNEKCECCSESEATIYFWYWQPGENKKICSSCFKTKMEELKEKNRL